MKKMLNLLSVITPYLPNLGVGVFCLLVVFIYLVNGPSISAYENKHWDIIVAAVTMVLAFAATIVGVRSNNVRTKAFSKYFGAVFVPCLYVFSLATTERQYGALDDGSLVLLVIVAVCTLATAACTIVANFFRFLSSKLPDSR